ncbi:hypothetical protein BJ508DRAFT_327454 [Ascobolus immersus RN42]|uniref:Uncharacterized protein n=1 Tax=Ascobolus immersus RN42 TaxID=1160509 RepID=A0A3N4I6N5_ASCIM|nr:hypothetical protein BJ508DRAFT_327454 [Ascobolus immersus RN42]
MPEAGDKRRMVRGKRKPMVKKRESQQLEEAKPKYRPSRPPVQSLNPALKAATQFMSCPAWPVIRGRNQPKRTRLSIVEGGGGGGGGGDARPQSIQELNAHHKPERTIQSSKAWTVLLWMLDEVTPPYQATEAPYTTEQHTDLGDPELRKKQPGTARRQLEWTAINDEQENIESELRGLDDNARIGRSFTPSHSTKPFSSSPPLHSTSPALPPTDNPRTRAPSNSISNSLYFYLLTTESYTTPKHKPKVFTHPIAPIRLQAIVPSNLNAPPPYPRLPPTPPPTNTTRQPKPHLATHPRLPPPPSTVPPTVSAATRLHLLQYLHRSLLLPAHHLEPHHASSQATSSALNAFLQPASRPSSTSNPPPPYPRLPPPPPSSSNRPCFTHQSHTTPRQQKPQPALNSFQEFACPLRTFRPPDALSRLLLQSSCRPHFRPHPSHKVPLTTAIITSPAASSTTDSTTARSPSTNPSPPPYYFSRHLQRTSLHYRSPAIKLISPLSRPLPLSSSTPENTPRPHPRNTVHLMLAQSTQSLCCHPHLEFLSPRALAKES